MALGIDIAFPVTPKKTGPQTAAASRPKVFYLRSSDLAKPPIADALRNNAVIFVNNPKRKLELYETPDEFLAAQTLAQGATAAQVFTKHYTVAAPTSSATAADQTTLRYLNDVTTNVASAVPLRLPDPFTRRLVVINNLTTASISVLGRGTTTPITSTGAASTAAYVIGPFERVHFVAPTAATAGTTAGWKVCIDAGTI